MREEGEIGTSAQGERLPEPTRLDIRALPLRPYVNLYRFGDGDAPPLVLYIGGAVTPTVYEARRSSPPTIIAATFDRARRALGIASVDLAISPCPIHEGGDREAWVTTLLDTIYAHLGAHAAGLGCVGYSAGAALALHLAALEPGSVAGVFGGAGIPRVLDEVRTLAEDRARGGDRLAVGWWMNLGDPLGMGGTDWMRRFAASIDFAPFSGPGQHPFADYDANGSVESAFRFVLARLTDRSDGGAQVAAR